MSNADKAFDGIVTTSMAVQTFKEKTGRWPATKEDLDQGAAAADVKFPRGIVRLNPQDDGSLTITFGDGAWFETWARVNLKDPRGHAATKSSK